MEQTLAFVQCFTLPKEDPKKALRRPQEDLKKTLGGEKAFHFV